MKRGADLNPVPGQSARKRPRNLPVRYYGQVSLVEQFDDTGDANAGAWLVNLDCFSADWFDGRQRDLSDLPPWNTIAQVGRARTIEFTEPTANDLLLRLRPALGNLAGPEDALGRWLQLALQVDTFQDEGLAVDLYLPAPGDTDPGLIASTGQVQHGARLVDVTAPGDEAQNKLDALTAIYSPEG